MASLIIETFGNHCMCLQILIKIRNNLKEAYYFLIEEGQ